MIVRLATPLRILSVLLGGYFAVFSVVPVILAVVTEAPIFVAFMGLPFAVVGLSIALWRRGVILDPAARRLTTWRGVGLPMLKTHHTLGRALHLGVTKEKRGSGRSMRTVFVVRVHQVEAVLEVLEIRDYAVARRMAEALADAMTVGMHDSSSGTTILREAGTLDEPLRDRILREHGGAAKPPETPPGRLTSRFAEQALVCDLPPSGFDFRRGTAILGGLAFAAVATTSLGKVSWADVGILFAVIAVVGIAVVVFNVVQMLSSSRVIVAADGITYDRRLRPKVHVAADELEEVIVVPREAPSGFSLLGIGGHVLLRSDKHSIALGGNMTSEESAWLHASICHMLVTQAWAGYR